MLWSQAACYANYLDLRMFQGTRWTLSTASVEQQNCNYAWTISYDNLCIRCDDLPLPQRAISRLHFH